MTPETLAGQVGSVAKTDPKAWAHKILQRYQAGDRTLTLHAIDLARKALNLPAKP